MYRPVAVSDVYVSQQCVELHGTAQNLLHTRTLLGLLGMALERDSGLEALLKQTRLTLLKKKRECGSAKQREGERRLVRGKTKEWKERNEKTKSVEHFLFLPPSGSGAFFNASLSTPCLNPIIHSLSCLIVISLSVTPLALLPFPLSPLLSQLLPTVKVQGGRTKSQTLCTRLR